MDSEIVHPVGSYCTDISRCTVNKTLNPVLVSDRCLLWKSYYVCICCTMCVLLFLL